jgi:predicted metal-binding membrane protein
VSPGPLLAAALRRGRLVVASALLLLSLVAWAGVLRFASWMTTPVDPAMAGMVGVAGMADMPGMEMPAVSFIALFAMWLVMMVGMMTPSVAPMLLLYEGVARQAGRAGHRFTSVGVFLAGYLTAWSLFSFAATLVHAGLEASGLLGSMSMRTSSRLGGLVLLVMGVYQWLPVKDRCLSQCRAPLQFIQQHGGFAADAPGAWRLGLRHGLYCVGCCWALMLLLFVVGVMNLAWIAALMLYVLAEKLLPEGQLLARLAGIAAVVVGARLLAAATVAG